MKNKIIIIILALSIVVVGIVFSFLLNKEQLSTITLDINPSMEIKYNKNDQVKSVKALNKDAKKIVSNDLKGKKLDDILGIIASKVIDNNYLDDDRLVIILYSDGKYNNDELEKKISSKFIEKNVDPYIIKINNITDEDKKVASKYNVSPAKAAYINSIKRENSKIPVENLINRNLNELEEIKVMGNYCKSGYVLHGDFCYKEKERYQALKGEVCPKGYYEFEGTCYEETPFIDTDEIICRDDFKLVDKKCVRELVDEVIPEYTCESGVLKTEGEIRWHGWKGGSACVDESTGQAPILRCLTNSGHVFINGKCANGPAPLIDGGCPNGDTAINGWCYSIDDEDQWVCPDGDIYEKSKGTYVEICPDTLTYTEPTVKGYKCHDGFKLKDNKCVKEEIEDTMKKRICQSGYEMVDYDRCINKNKVADKISGYVCLNDDTLEGKECIIYDVIEAIHN